MSNTEFPLIEWCEIEITEPLDFGITIGDIICFDTNYDRKAFALYATNVRIPTPGDLIQGVATNELPKGNTGKLKFYRSGGSH